MGLLGVVYWTRGDRDGALGAILGYEAFEGVPETKKSGVSSKVSPRDNLGILEACQRIKVDGDGAYATKVLFEGHARDLGVENAPFSFQCQKKQGVSCCWHPSVCGDPTPSRRSFASGVCHIHNEIGCDALLHMTSLHWLHTSHCWQGSIHCTDNRSKEPHVEIFFTTANLRMLPVSLSNSLLNLCPSHDRNLDSYLSSCILNIVILWSVYALTLRIPNQPQPCWRATLL